MGAAMTVKKSTATGRLCLGSAGLALLLGIALGPALAVEMPDACDYKPGPEAKPFDVKVGAEFNSDYIYRGVTLSAHQPAMGFSVEVDRGPFYFTFEPHTVNLPTAPRPSWGFPAAGAARFSTSSSSISASSISIMRTRFPWDR